MPDNDAPKSDNFQSFVRAFWPNLFALMSGGPSVPAAIAALYVDPLWAKILLWITVATCLVFAAYFVWRSERRKVMEMTEKLRPKIKYSFSMTDAGCYRPNSVITFTYVEASGIPHHEGTTLTPSLGAVIRSSQLKCDYYRVKIKADCVGSVPQCSARITSIKKDGHIVMQGENLQLTIAPAERDNPFTKDLLDKSEEYVDAVAITEDGRILPTTRNFNYPSSIDVAAIFNGPGEYTLRFVISSPATVSVTGDLVLQWNGNWKTADMRCL